MNDNMTVNETERLPEMARSAAADTGTNEIDLVELLYRLLEKWKIIVAVALLCALAAGIYVFRFVTPTYRATSKIYMLSTDSAINLADLQLANNLNGDYQEVFKNWHVHELVLEEIGLDYTYTQISDMLSVSNPSNTRVLYISVTSPSPDEAKLIADAYAKVASEFIADTMGMEKPSIFEEALKPTVPYSPNKRNAIVIGFLAGFLAACAVVTVRFLYDDRIHTGEDITRHLGMPMLGSVPKQKGRMIPLVTKKSGEERRP